MKIRSILLRKIVMLVSVVVLAVGMSCMVSASTLLWLSDGIVQIRQGKVFQSENMTVGSGKQKGRIHTTECTSPGYVYMARNTKGWFFWDEVAIDKKYVSAKNQYINFDLGEEDSSENTYYTLTNFEGAWDSGSKVDIKLNEISVTINN